jgi:hypothetical protein
LVLLCIGGVFGGTAIELAGRVIEPAYQKLGIGTLLLEDFITRNDPQYLTTYTRNASVIKMVQRVSSSVFPLEKANALGDMAGEMNNATMQDGTAYHLNRYSDDGLFGGEDPATRRFDSQRGRLIDEFTQLSSVRNALVVAAKVKKGLR